MRAARPCLALILALAWPAAAQVPQALDAGAPEGAELTTRRTADLGSYGLPVGRFGREARPVRPLEGRVVRAAWRLDGAEWTPEEVVSDYRVRLGARGFEPLFLCHDRACGGFDFRFGVELLPAPEMLMDTGDFSQLSLAAPGGRFASVLASRVLGTIYVQTVMVEGGEREDLPPAPPPVAEADEQTPQPPPGPETPPPQDEPQPFADPPTQERPLLEALRRDGHVAVAGLAFEPGGARISAESTPAIDRIAAMLARQPELNLAVVGHSDNVGGLDLNIALSRRRAEAVREAMIARNIAPQRLEAHGVGWLAPVASNLTEEGRRRNRRVELVLK